jgi:hypothetical protein
LSVLLALPLLVGAKDEGCALGGQLGVGSGGSGGTDAGGENHADANVGCTPADCAGLGALADAKQCDDGSWLTRSECTREPSGLCAWDFPACPASDGGQVVVPPACPIAACQNKARPNVLVTCADGTVVGFTMCSPNSSGECDWALALCPGPTGVADGSVGSPVADGSVHQCTSVPPPKEPCFECDPLPPGSQGGCASPPQGGNATPSTLRYPQGCKVVLPTTSSFYPGAGLECTCEEFPGQGLTFICPA